MFYSKPKTLTQIIQSDLVDATLDLQNQRLRCELATSMVDMLTDRVARLKIDLEQAKNDDDQTPLQHSHRQT